MRAKSIFLTALIAGLIVVTGPVVASAHSGGTDAYGCHAGSRPYHCHGSTSSSGTGTTSVTIAPTTTSTTIAPVTTTTAATQQIMLVFKNCTEVRKTYRWGVAKSLQAAKKQKNYPVNNPFVSASIYKSLEKMDQDRDGTACEK